MTPVESLDLVTDAFERVALRLVEADLGRNQVVELAGNPDEVAAHLAGLLPLIVLYDALFAAAPSLDPADGAHRLLLDEYADRFADEPTAAVVAAPVAGVLVGASFVVEAWVEFDERCDAALEPATPTEAQIDAWAQLCAEDPDFRRVGGQGRFRVARDLIGLRAPHDVIKVVEAAALDRMKETLGPEARRLRAEGASKTAIRATLGVPESLVEQWLGLTNRRH